MWPHMNRPSARPLALCARSMRAVQWLLRARSTRPTPAITSLLLLIHDLVHPPLDADACGTSGMPWRPALVVGVFAPAVGFSSGISHNRWSGRHETLVLSEIRPLSTDRCKHPARALGLKSYDAVRTHHLTGRNPSR